VIYITSDQCVTDNRPTVLVFLHMQQLGGLFPIEPGLASCCFDFLRFFPGENIWVFTVILQASCLPYPYQ